MDIDECMREIENERKEKEKAKLQKFFDKVSDDKDTLYHAFALLICDRFDLSNKYNISWIPSVAYNILDYYIENVDEPFQEWLRKNDAPFIRTVSEVKRIFYEIPSDDIYELVDTVNSLYGLDLDICDGCDETYIYSFSFDFNSFTPLPVGEIKDLMNEVHVLKKYGYPTEELKRKLDSYGLSEEQLNKI